MEFKEICAIYYKKHEASKEKYFNKIGIYCIKDEIGKIIYVGKSTNLFHRFISHQINTEWADSKEYNSRKYTLLREYTQEGHSISFEVLEYCDKEILSARENYYISKYYPNLNNIVPCELTHKHCKKKIQKFW